MAPKPPRKVLYLVHRVPYPPNRGDRIRSFHLLKFLAARAEVHLAYLSEEAAPQPAADMLRDYCARVGVVRLGRRTRWLHGARSMAVGRPATEGLFYSRRFQRLVRRWTDDTAFDAVVVFCSSMVQYLDVPGLAGIPVVVDLVDVDSQKWFDYAEHARGPRRLLFRLEGRRLRRLEASLPSRVAAVTLVSHSEAGLYRAFCAADCVYAIPNGVDLDQFCPMSAPDQSQQCVFVGALDYRANVDGIAWYCDHVWPEVRRRRPQSDLLIIGSNPVPAVRRLADIPGVRLAGPVPDVRPYLAEAAVSVAPLRIARGLQNKVLEALAMGKAVIATPQAREGLDVQPGRHLLEAATPAEWIQSTLELLDDPTLRASLGRAGRAFVEQHHRWQDRLEPFASLLSLGETEPQPPSTLAVNGPAAVQAGCDR